MDRLNYISSEQYFEGIIVDINDCAITIDFKGRLGEMKIPRRMVISNYKLEIGQEVGFIMSYPEVLSKEINEDYVNNIKKRNLEKED
ncbi:MAG TPA: CBO2463/CBO2479 domain-containing protein [Tissierellales bacterium]|nr:CBO2463/CBO2479 domain-containing protein [Tissierellales bacterium]